MSTVQNSNIARPSQSTQTGYLCQFMETHHFHRQQLERTVLWFNLTFKENASVFFPRVQYNYKLFTTHNSPYTHLYPRRQLNDKVHDERRAALYNVSNLHNSRDWTIERKRAKSKINSILVRN
jgi:hypothetical protein